MSIRFKISRIFHKENNKFANASYYMYDCIERDIEEFVKSGYGLANFIFDFVNFCFCFYALKLEELMLLIFFWKH